MNVLRAAACTLLFASATSARAECHMSAAELPVRMEGARAIATLGINGTPVPLIVDTGAFFSLLTPASAEELGLTLQRLPEGASIEGLAGSMVRPRKTTVKTVQLLNTELSNVDFLVGGNDSGLGGMGVLGRNILSMLDTEYDLAHGMIRFVKTTGDCDKVNMAYWSGDTPVSEVELLRENTRARPSIRARLQLNGHEVTALFDTGASTLVSLSAAHKTGVKDADLRDASTAFGAGRGMLNSWTASFDTVALGGETVIHNRLGVTDFDARDFDMLVGIDFFLSHRIYVATESRRMFFTYNGGPVFARNVELKSPGAATAASAVADTLSADELFRRGSASLARNDFAAALADLDRACALEPGNARFHFARGQAYASLKEPRKAMAELDAALSLDPRLDDARLMRATSRPRDGDRAPSLHDLDMLDDTLPPSANMRASLARVYDDLGAPTMAIKEWTLWIANHRDDVRVPAARNARCWARAEADIELAEAMDDCNAAIDDESHNTSYRDSRGWLQLRLNQPAKASADFDVALKAKPDAAWSLYGRGVARGRLGETAASQADLAAARKTEPKIDAMVKDAGFEPAP